MKKLFSIVVDTERVFKFEEFLMGGGGGAYKQIIFNLTPQILRDSHVA